MQVYEIKDDNINKLYSLYLEKGYFDNLNDFSKDLFKLQNNPNSFFKTLAIEIDNKIVASVQYGRIDDDEGVIRLLHCDSDDNKYIKELLLKANSYFYMLHINKIKIDSSLCDNLYIKELFNDSLINNFIN